MWAFDATRTNCGTCSHFLFALSATIGRGDQVLASFKPMQCHNWETIVKTDPLHDKSGLSAAMSPAHERGGVCLVDISVYQQCLMRVFARVCCRFRVLCSSSASFSSAIASSFRLCYKMPLLIHFSFHFHISFILWNCKTKSSPALIKLMFVGFWRDSKSLASRIKRKAATEQKNDIVTKNPGCVTWSCLRQWICHGFPDNGATAQFCHSMKGEEEMESSSKTFWKFRECIVCCGTVCLARDICHYLV